MRLLGEIVRLQVQTSSLKMAGPRFRAYDPAPIRAVPGLALDDGGATGLGDPGEAIADVHHRDHPATKYRGDNALSVGFTGHYATMRERFGPHLADGTAGENILVALDRIVPPEAMASGLLIETAAGPVRLGKVIVAVPCVEFARWALRFPETARPDRRVTEAVRFLDDGIRGYYAALADAPARLAVGDRVYAIGTPPAR